VVSRLFINLANVIDQLKTGLRGWPADARAWLRERGLELWLITALWAVISVVIFWLATGHESPRRYQDEFLFWGVAKSWANGLGLTWRGTDLALRSWLYPVMLAPAFWLGKSVPTSYTIIHLINTLMIVGTIFPAFLMARMYVARGPAVLAALLAVSVPAMNYAGIIGTENLGYLTSTAAFGAMILSITKPRLRNWILAFALILVAMLTRTQFVTYLPIYIAAIVLAGLLRGPGKRREFFREQKWVLIGSGALVGLAALAFLVMGRKVVGLYGGVFDGVSPNKADIWFWLKAFAGDVYILAGFVPVIATIAMWGHKENRRDPLVGALLALALVATMVFLAQMTWFSATNQYDWRNRHIFYERYMFYLGPLYFTGFIAAWRRVSVGSAVLSVAFAVVVMTGFQSDALLPPFSYDSFGLSLLGWFVDAHPDWTPNIGRLLAELTLFLGAIYVVSTVKKEAVARIGMLVSTMLVLAILIGGQAKSWQYARLFSHDAFLSFPRPANFIDLHTDQDVGMIITSSDAPELYFQQEFWNDRIVRAFATDEKPFQSPIIYSPKCEFDWDKTGAILGTGCDKVPSAFFLRSDTVAMHLKDETKRVHPSVDWPNLTLMVGEPPPRILSIVDGRTIKTGVVQGLMHVRTFLDKPGDLRVTVGKSAVTHDITVGKDTTRVPAGSDSVITVPIPAMDNETDVSIKNKKGLPDSAVITGLEVREPGGEWISIL
jgi:hypothetical protein